MLKKIKLIIIFIGIIFLATPVFASANFLGQKVNFFIDPSFDLTKREQIVAVLVGISPKLYFYLDDNWWNSKNIFEQTEIKNIINFLAVEFEEKIYPTLTLTFGSEPKPGIDKDERITVLIHPMIREVGGYFNSGDGYSRLQNPKSNQREMVYLNSQHLDRANLRSFLAHEFMHLITFNQKDLLRRVSEEIWLNEARAEYIPTLLGYDDIYENSNLQMRVRHFLERSHDPLTEWLNFRHDYGVINLFTQYLVDHYGVKILVDSLQSSEVGIPSINYALRKNGFKENFSQIFNNWKIAILINDCGLGAKYCYLSPHLSKLKVIPLTNFLPFVGQGTLAVAHTSKNWSANWHRFIGGRGVLRIEFNGDNRVNFEVPYIIEDLDRNMTIGFLDLDKNQDGKIYIEDFNNKNRSLTILPSIQDKVLGFNGEERSFSFSWTASIVEKTPEQEAELKKKLLEQIAFLQKEIARLQRKMGLTLFSCQRLENNLYYGIRNNSEVRCLQEFLKTQGPEIYPEGLITGNFLTLTRTAVIRFQEKYASEILIPLGLEKGTGFVGKKTLIKINEIIGR